MNKYFLLSVLISAVSADQGSYGLPQGGLSQGGSVENQDGPDVPPVYAFSYDIADNDEQVYVTAQENRNEDETSGSYSYITPDGARITVTYTANADTGYEADVHREEGVIDIASQETSFVSNGAGSSQYGAPAVAPIAPTVDLRSLGASNSASFEQGTSSYTIKRTSHPTVQVTAGQDGQGFGHGSAGAVQAVSQDLIVPTFDQDTEELVQGNGDVQTANFFIKRTGGPTVLGGGSSVTLPQLQQSRVSRPSSGYGTPATGQHQQQQQQQRFTTRVLGANGVVYQY